MILSYDAMCNVEEIKLGLGVYTAMPFILRLQTKCQHISAKIYSATQEVILPMYKHRSMTEIQLLLFQSTCCREKLVNILFTRETVTIYCSARHRMGSLSGPIHSTTHTLNTILYDVTSSVLTVMVQFVIYA